MYHISNLHVFGIILATKFGPPDLGNTSSFSRKRDSLKTSSRAVLIFSRRKIIALLKEKPEKKNLPTNK